MSIKTLLVAFMSAILFFDLSIGAQEPTAVITGRIVDPSGAIVADASVEVVSVATSAHWNAVSNQGGYYTAPQLLPGGYTITVRKAGFKPIVRSGVTLVISEVARLDFQLQIGDASQSIQVTSEAPLVESESASLGQVVQQQAIQDLPLNGRNYLQLARLSMGVTEPKPGDRGAPGASFIANGVRSQFNNYMLDGIDNRSQLLAEQNQSPVVIQPSVDALGEFKVETNAYSSEYGYSAGAVVNATIKSGSNKFHGDVFEFLRNSKMDARDYFLSPSAGKPILQRNQFGATFGGPAVKNKTFFFASWETTHQNSGVTLVRTLPTPAMEKGNFAGLNPIFDPATTRANPNGAGFIRDLFPGNVIPQGRISAVATNLIALLPPANLPGAVNNFVVGPKQVTAPDRYDGRMDQNFSEKDKLFARYSYFTQNYINPGPFPPPLVGAFSASVNSQATEATSGWIASLGETHLFTPRLLNDFRIGFNRLRDDKNSYAQDYNASKFGFTGIPQQAGVGGLPAIAITGFANLGEAAYVPSLQYADDLDVRDNVFWSHGSHSLKMGGGLRWVRTGYVIAGDGRGNFSFNGVFTQNPLSRPGTGVSFADFMLGVPSGADIDTVFSGDIRYFYYAGFLEDDWKITSRLTMNIGVRYEYWNQPYERHDGQDNFLPDQAKFIFPYNKPPAGFPASLVTQIPAGVDSRALLKEYYLRFAPRLGIAYQLTSKTVIRTGAGEFFAEPPQVGANTRLVGNPPGRVNSSYPTDQITPIITLQTGFPGNALTFSPATLPNSSLRHWDVNFKPASVWKWSLGAEHEWKSLLFDANYVGTKGTHLSQAVNFNQPLPGGAPVAARRPIPGFGDVIGQTPLGNSSYNALETRVERRYARGFSLLAAYTYSKSIDEAGEELIEGVGAVRTFNNIAAERALSVGDIRHRFVASFTYNLPFGHQRLVPIRNHVADAVLGGWQLNGIATIRTGQPFTPSLSFSPANTGDPRPNRIRDGNLPSGGRDINHYFDTRAFVAAIPYNFGNSGRDVLIGPGADNWDLSLFKHIPVRPLGEAGDVQFRAEFFNSFNHPQFGQPNPVVDIPQGGTITSLVSPMRQIQFGVKVIF